MAFISISGKETKQHLAAALKQVFPGFRFSLRSNYDCVRVSWTDGPVVEDVQRVLNRFVSYTYVYSRTDFTRPTGYEWEGQQYLGPRYLDSTRQLSEQRRTQLMEWMAARGLDYFAGTVQERAQAERELIRAGLLSGMPPLDLPELMRDERPSVDERKPHHL